MAEPGAGDADGGAASERTVGVEDPSRDGTQVGTVYDDIRHLLTERGWVQGRETRGTRLSLTGAIDAVVGLEADARVDAERGPVLARSSRMQRHLSELAGVSNLIAWNDNRERNVTEVMDLLTFAAVAYPDD